MFRHRHAVKKGMAVLLSVMTAMSLMTVPAFAAENTDEPVKVKAEEGESKTVEVGDVTVETEEGEYPIAGVCANADGGTIDLKTGNITTGGKEELGGTVAFAENGGKINAEIGDTDANGDGVSAGAYGEDSVASLSTGGITADVIGLSTYASFGGSVEVEVKGDIAAQYMGVGAAAYDFDDSGESKIAIDVEGNVFGGDMGTMAVSSGDNSAAVVLVNGDVTGGSYGVDSKAYNGGKTLVTVNGDVTGGSIDPEYEYDTFRSFVTSQAAGEGSEAMLLVNGDVIASDKAGAAVAAGGRDGGTATVVITGTVQGGDIPIVIGADTDLDDVNITVWKVEPNKSGAIAGVINDDWETVTPSAEVEKAINYIIKLEDTSGATLNAVDTAHEGEKVVLKIDLDSDYELLGAYNGQGEKVALQKDANGDWYVIVPRGGGVYLSVETSKIKKDKDDDDKDKNKNVIQTTTASGASYASAEAFGAAGASMIASAAPGATVTINATSFTSLPASIVAALMARPDVTFVFTYVLNGVTFKVTIPAGTNLSGLLNASGGIDFASLAAFTKTV